MYICDTKGVSWLVEESSGAVFSLKILLSVKEKTLGMESLSASQPFSGILRVGKYSVRGAISFETAEMMRDVTVSNITIFWLPGRHQMKGLVVGFERNENGSAGRP